MIRKNAALAFFLSVIPGLGHMYLNKYGRAFLYAFSFFGLGALFLLLTFLSNDDQFGMVGAMLCFIIWVVNGLDMIFSLMAGAASRPLPSYSYGPGETPAGGAEEHSGMEGGAEGYAGYPASSRSGTDERFFTILLSMIPGLGHFQLGLMQRGLTLLIGFFGLGIMVVFVSALTNEESFLVFMGALPIIWLYSMFDAVQLLHRKQRGETLEDRTILEDLDRHREDGRKSRLVATLLSIFPGAGHLYLGLQRRGLQLMAFFLFSIYILDVLHLSLFLFLIPLIWFFSFFDALQQISRYQERVPLTDAPLVDWLMNHQRWVGIGLLALGGFYLLDHVLVELLQRMFSSINIYRYYNEYFQTTLVSFLLIAGGIKLLSGSRKRKEADTE
ncbi:hypothetical protein [Paenibacillus gansuensis]|uniref:Multi-TM2 domain-containing protein n=1 Tax=Paenibacillus gansuensis TaxID=306542 RepID=A0ABW5PGZ9_9BACL